VGGHFFAPLLKVTKIDSIRGPVDFSSADTGPQGHVPSLGEHTAEVLEAYGISLSGRAKL
jgi:crotonobetainyl-CoA:carnitine CoA-transferase CaiB-like acyl-CoA transferase